MIEIPLGKKSKYNGMVALIDDEDLDIVGMESWRAKRDGHGYAFYAVKTVSGDQEVRMHRLIVGAIPGEETDHINGNGLDNRRSNLRIASRAQNGRNRRLMSTNTSGYQGVTMAGRGKWMTKITVDRKSIYLGTFNSVTEAALVYDEQARLLHGEFARLNFPDESKNERSAKAA